MYFLKVIIRKSKQNNGYRKMINSTYATYEGNNIYSMVINGQVYRAKINFGDNAEEILKGLA